MYESFLKDKEYAVGVSPKTMIYLRNMGSKHFLPIIAPAKDEAELRKLVLEATGRIQGLRRARPGPGQSNEITARSKNTYLGPLRTFLGWLLEEEIIVKAIRVKKLKVPRPLRKTLTFGQIVKLLDYKCTIKSRMFGIARIQAAVALMCDCGLRSSEWRNLKIADIDMDRREVKVWGKGSIERLVTFTPECRKIVARWIRRLPERSVYAFPTSTGRPVSGRNALRDLVWLGARCQIWHVNLHLLRHSFGTIWIRNGGSVEMLRRCMGHANIQTTLQYLHNDTADMEAAHSQFSPLSRMK